METAGRPGRRRSRRRAHPPDGDADAVTNIGNPAELSIRELAEIVINVTGSRSNIVIRPLPADDPRQRQHDIAKARHALGWTPRPPSRRGWCASLPILRHSCRNMNISRLPHPPRHHLRRNHR
jgi:UDP-glucuronate decarboxylase